MDNFNNNDNKIRNTLSQDKYITDSNKNTINNYIPNEKVKPKKVSQAQKNFIIFLLIIILLLVALILYLYENKSDTKLSDSPKEKENSIELIDKTINQNTNLSETSNLENENRISSEVSNSNTFAIEDFKNFLNYYGYAINRLSNLNNDELEKNTIYVYMAMKYFDSQASKSSGLNTMNTQFAKNVENVNKFIYDISKIQITEPLATYEDYVTYSGYSKSYEYGKNSNILEQYKCTNAKIESTTNDGYNVIAQISRITADSTINYEVSINVQLNEDYSYVPYYITSIVPKNLTEDFDTTFHLINLYNFTADDLKSAKTSLITAINRENKSQSKDISIDYTININSITQRENGFYELNATAFYIDAEKKKIENHYSAIIIKENNNISVKNLTKLDN